MTITTLPAQFEQTPLDIVIIGNERWVRGYQIGSALGYVSSAAAMAKLYRRNSKEFHDDDTMVVEMPSAGGRQLTRLYSAKGVAKIAMLANTEKAAGFRDWASTMLTTPKPDREVSNLKHAPDLRDELLATQRELINAQAMLIGRARKTTRVTIPWTSVDDELLIKLTKEQGRDRDWNAIAGAMGRSIQAVSSRGHILRVKGLVQ